MRNNGNGVFKGLAVAALLAALPLTGHAATTWTFNYASGCTSGGSWHNNCSGEDFSRTYSGSDGSTVLIQGVANNGGENGQGTLQLATVNVWDGIGVQHEGETSSSPQHSTDNSGRVEAVLFDFGAGNSIALSEVTIGWPNDGSYDTDISVLAYVPDGVAAIAAEANGESSYVSLGASYNDLIGQGWIHIGNYNDLNKDSPETINAGGVSSRYWLVGAANPVFGGLNGNKDKFKISAVSGSPGTGCNGDCGSTPIPGTLLLFGIGFVAAGRRYLKTRP